MPCTKYQFSYAGSFLSNVDNYKYLGFLINEHGSIIPGGESLASAGERALGSVINKIKKNGDVGYLAFMQLYSSCVLPMIDYCSGIWGLGNEAAKVTQIDKLQDRAKRFFLGVDKHTLIAALNGELPMLGTESRRLIDGVRFYNSILQLPDDRLVKKIYKASHNVCKNNWCSTLKDQLIKIGFGKEWHEQSTINLGTLESRLVELADENWRKDCLAKTKLCTYCVIDEHRNVPLYVRSNIPKYHRSLIAKLRIGTLPIKLERGRYAGIPVADRICEMCSSGTVEDEYHFVFECSKYADIRKNWAEKIGLIPHRNNLKSDFELVFQKRYFLGKYLKQLMNLRNCQKP